MPALEGGVDKVNSDFKAFGYPKSCSKEQDQALKKLFSNVLQ